MKYHIYFTGYSDDVVLAGTCKKDFDEHYASFFLLSNGIVVKAAHSGETGWKIEPTEMPADGVTIIDAIDLEDEGKDHTDERIPEWLDAPGYAPVCIIEADEPLEVVASSDRRSPFTDTSPEFIFAARLRKAVLKASHITDSEDAPSIEAFMQGLRVVQKQKALPVPVHYLIVKPSRSINGLLAFYAADSKGYTVCTQLAGRFTESEAAQIVNGASGELIALRESDLERFAILHVIDKGYANNNTEFVIHGTAALPESVSA